MLADGWQQATFHLRYAIFIPIVMRSAWNLKVLLIIRVRLVMQTRWGGFDSMTRSIVTAFSFPHLSSVIFPLSALQPATFVESFSPSTKATHLICLFLFFVSNFPLISRIKAHWFCFRFLWFSLHKFPTIFHGFVTVDRVQTLVLIKVSCIFGSLCCLSRSVVIVTRIAIANWFTAIMLKILDYFL